MYVLYMYIHWQRHWPSHVEKDVLVSIIQIHDCRTVQAGLKVDGR